MHDRKLYVAGQWVEGEQVAEVRAPFDGSLVARVGQAGPAQVEAALAFAFEGRARVARLATFERRAVLQRIARGLETRREELAASICAEAGKPLQAAKTEVARAIEVFTLAAAELTAGRGEVVPVDLDAASRGYHCEVRRVPAGVVVGIVPFNFPLNLGAHKVAPALAVGAPIIIKPPPQAPSAQLLLAQIAADAGADPAALQVLACDNSRAEQLATDARVRVLSFTGSAKVGWHLKSRIPGKALLELGGNAAVYLAEDAELDWAVQRCVAGAFGYAGQVCIKVQRLFVHERRFPELREQLLAQVRALGVGDPASEATVVGPVIDERSAQRIEAWVKEATDAGARVLTGGPRRGLVLPPTVLTGVPVDAKVVREEVFGPVLVLEQVKDDDEGLRRINQGDYGLQAGVFTHDLRLVRRAFDELEVGGVLVNDAPTFRSDNFPYGGVKSSGLGREGVRYAMEELTELRALVMSGH